MSSTHLSRTRVLQEKVSDTRGTTCVSEPSVERPPRLFLGGGTSTHGPCVEPTVLTASCGRVTETVVRVVGEEGDLQEGRSVVLVLETDRLSTTPSAKPTSTPTLSPTQSCPQESTDITHLGGKEGTHSGPPTRPTPFSYSWYRRQETL